MKVGNRKRGGGGIFHHCIHLLNFLAALPMMKVCVCVCVCVGGWAIGLSSIKNVGCQACFVQRGTSTPLVPSIHLCSSSNRKERGRDSTVEKRREDRGRSVMGSEKQGSMRTCLSRTVTWSSGNGDGFWT